LKSAIARPSFDVPPPERLSLAFALALTVAALVIAWLATEPWLIERRRRALRARPFPEAWRRIIAARVPQVARMPVELRRELEGHIHVFLAEKRFSGCAGLEIDDEVRVTIAAQACLLLLDRPAGYFPGLRQVLVYPGAFLVERLRPEPSGVLQETRQVLSGESWSNGQVVLSWEDTLAGAAAPDDGRNVVLHEFAHQLDQEKGYANGAPGIASRRGRERWARVMGEEYARLQYNVMTQAPSLFSAYGATAPAEFFAVITETFFEQPALMRHYHAELYSELTTLYRVDPAAWPGANLLRFDAPQPSESAP
jgi:Mlc titration factor MtfA (ptsG expression regulator)